MSLCVHSVSPPYSKADEDYRFFFHLFSIFFKSGAEKYEMKHFNIKFAIVLHDFALSLSIWCVTWTLDLCIKINNNIDHPHTLLNILYRALATNLHKTCFLC